MTQPTFDWDDDTGGLQPVPESKEYSVDYTDGSAKGKSFGSRITVNAFHQLLKGALKTQDGQKAPSVRYVEFSKASVFRVLSQPGCEYIRFYFVYPEKDKMSLVLEGLDADGQALKLESHVMKMAAGSKSRAAREDDPDYEELGHGAEAFSAAATATASAESATSSKRAAKVAEETSLAALLKAINTKGSE